MTRPRRRSSWRHWKPARRKRSPGYPSNCRPASPPWGRCERCSPTGHRPGQATPSGRCGSPRGSRSARAPEVREVVSLLGARWFEYLERMLIEAQKQGELGAFDTRLAAERLHTRAPRRPQRLGDLHRELHHPGTNARNPRRRVRSAPEGQRRVTRLTPNDLSRQVAIGQLDIAPAGDLIVYTRREVRADRDRVNLWLVDTAGGPERRLTDGPHWDVRPRFSPDGAHIAFVSDRGDGATELHVVPTTGGPAQQISGFPRGLARGDRRSTGTRAGTPSWFAPMTMCRGFVWAMETTGPPHGLSLASIGGSMDSGSGSSRTPMCTWCRCSGTQATSEPEPAIDRGRVVGLAASVEPRWISGGVPGRHPVRRLRRRTSHRSVGSKSPSPVASRAARRASPTP